MLSDKYCLSDSQQEIIDLDKWQQSVDLMSELYGSVNGSIVQFQQNQFTVIATSSNKDNFLEKEDNWPSDIKSFCREIVESNRPLYVPNAVIDSNWNDAPPVEKGPVRSYCGLPIHWPDGSIFGTICIIDVKSSSYSDTLLKLLEQFCLLIAADLKMACDLEDLKSLALTDELTSLHNRRGLTLLGEQRIKDAIRSKQVIGLTYLDIDNLKMMNDRAGHLTGDHCIQTLANSLNETCRENDIKARVGGDEFIIITLFDDSASNQQEVLDKLAIRIREHYLKSVQKHDERRITSISSGGVAFRTSELVCLDDMIKKADELMYQHKKNKRIHS
ncbi:sensor domain-containing diguanylate cyclase [uncultured Vibrio sp.]|uniref:sensor domain-containing diguanylate cyclase n=1 Tax=uncultured Vibrio sp. TaxID=114054 RepID=UPI00091941AE|nr:sensor domain-containing diguanylate cyclase [uncultured Vibrio sp.]OIQ26324.1 MAG: diguanylate cyclase [Vibrio sp. MedPE-SWchi]